MIRYARDKLVIRLLFTSECVVGDVSAASKLFGYVPLPEWDRVEFFVLWKRAKRQKAQVIDDDAFARMCMVLVAHYVLSKGWQRTLAKNEIEQEDAAQEVVSRLLPKLKRFKLKHRDTKADEQMTLMKSAIQAVVRLLQDVCRSAKRKSNIRSGSGGEWESYTASRTSPSNPLAELSRRMDSATVRICGDDTNLARLYRELCASVLNGKHVPRYDDIVRAGLFPGINADQYAEIVIGINCLVQECAADADTTQNAG